jgi:L-asparaginase
VLAGFGSGTFPPAFLQAGTRAVPDGIPVALASRSTSGRIIMTPKKEETGFIVADDLSPQKARILLTLALTTSHARQAIQGMFYTFRRGSAACGKLLYGSSLPSLGVSTSVLASRRRAP